jgi:predicted DNA-binding transcriptional regulator AlpA
MRNHITMALIEKRSNGNYRVKIRRKGSSALSATFPTKAQARQWAAMREGDIVGMRQAARASAASLPASGLDGVHPIIAKLDELIQVTRQAAMGDRYLDTRDVAALFSYSENYTRRKIVPCPDFPKPFRMGDGRSRWLKSDVMKWAASKRLR